MTRFFIPQEQWQGERVVLRGGDAHHALRVLRLGPGDRFLAVLPDGSEAEVVVEAAGEQVAGRIVVRRRPRREPRLRVHLAQALIKGDKFDWVVQKGTEVGIASFLPFAGARSVVRLDGERAARRAERWRRIAREAAEQCGRLVVPAVHDVTDLSGVRAACGRVDLALLAWESERGRGLFDALAARFGAPEAGVGPSGGTRDRAGADVLLIVGPEGGFEQEEARRLAEAGAEPVSLGPLIFRTETAGVAAAVMMLYHAGDLGRAPEDGSAATAP